MDRRTFLKGALATALAYGLPVRDVRAKNKRSIEEKRPENKRKLHYGSEEANRFIYDIEQLYRHALDSNISLEEQAQLVHKIENYISSSKPVFYSYDIINEDDSTYINRMELYVLYVKLPNNNIIGTSILIETEEENNGQDRKVNRHYTLNADLINRCENPNYIIHLNGIKNPEIHLKYRQDSSNSIDGDIVSRTPEGKRIIKQALDKFFKEIRK